MQLGLLFFEEEHMYLAAAAVAVRHVARRRLRRRGRKPREVWSRLWLQRRQIFGQYDALLQELNREDPGEYKNYLRIQPDLFQEMVERLSPYITKFDFAGRALEPALKIAITLRYMATGNTYRSLQYEFRVARNTICLFVPEVANAIIQEYSHQYLNCPQTPEEWEKVAEDFATMWNFQNTIGAVDGKHVAIKCPANSGSYYFNYKGFFSIVLMAIADAKYKY